MPLITSPSSLSRILSRVCQPVLLSAGTSKRFVNNRHTRLGDKKLWNMGIYDYRYKFGRHKKVAKIKLPDMRMESEDSSSMTPDQMRSLMKEKGVAPPRKWDERPISITCSGDLFNPFDPDRPPQSVLVKTKELARRAYDRPVGQIVKYLPDFDPKVFATQDAVSIYCKAHELLAKLGSAPDLTVRDEDLLQFVTEKCYPEMLFRVHRKTIHWKWLANLEPPKFIKAAVTPGMDGYSAFGQVTVRLHSQQTLAVYDQFGRLMAGGENVVKDVLEYVVYENFLSNSLGTWRIHGKILPKDAGHGYESLLTYRDQR